MKRAQLCECTRSPSTTVFAFQQYNSRLPEAALNTPMKAYPLWNRSKLNTELSLIYSSDEFKICSTAVALYHLSMEKTLFRTPSQRLWLC